MAWGWKTFPPAWVDGLLYNPPENIKTLIPYMDAWQFIYEALQPFVEALPHQPPEHRRPVHGYVKAFATITDKKRKASSPSVMVEIGEVGYNVKTKEVIIKTNKISSHEEKEVRLPVSTVLALICRVMIMIPIDLTQELGTIALKKSAIKDTKNIPTPEQMTEQLFFLIRNELSKKGINLPELDGSYNENIMTNNTENLIPSMTNLALYNIPVIEYSQMLYNAIKEIYEAMPHHPPRECVPLFVGGIKVKIRYVLKGIVSKNTVYNDYKKPSPSVILGNNLSIIAEYSTHDRQLAEATIYSRDFQSNATVVKLIEEGDKDTWKGIADSVLTEGLEVEPTITDEKKKGKLTCEILEFQEGDTNSYEEVVGTDEEDNDIIETKTIITPNIVYLLITQTSDNADPVSLNLPTVATNVKPIKLVDVYAIPDSIAIIENSLPELGTIVNGFPTGITAKVHRIVEKGTKEYNPNPKIGMSSGTLPIFTIALTNETKDTIEISTETLGNYVKVGKYTCAFSVSIIEMQLEQKKLQSLAEKLKQDAENIKSNGEKLIADATNSISSAKKIIEEQLKAIANSAGDMSIIKNAKNLKSLAENTIKKGKSMLTSGDKLLQQSVKKLKNAGSILDDANRLKSKNVKIIVRGKSFSYKVEPITEESPYYDLQTNALGGELDSFGVEFGTSLWDNAPFILWQKEIKEIFEEFSFSANTGAISTGVKRYLHCKVKYKYLTENVEHRDYSTPTQVPHGELHPINIYYNAVTRYITIERIGGDKIDLKTSSAIWFFLQLLMMIPISRS